VHVIALSYSAFSAGVFSKFLDKGIGIVTGFRYDSNMGSNEVLGSPKIGQLLNVSPGPDMAALLATISKEELSAADRVHLMQAHQKMVSYYQAELYSDMVALWQHDQGDQDLGEHFAFVVSELRAALHLTRRAAETELGTAIDLIERAPLIGDSLLRGEIDLRRAKVFGYATVHLPDEIRRAVIEHTIGDARYLTGGQLRALLRRVCIKVDPEAAQRRYEKLVSDRRVISDSDPDGTASLMGLDLPPERVQAAMDYVTSLAKSLVGANDDRTLDQLRADIFLDLLAGHPLTKGGRGKGMVDIRVDLATLACLADDPGELGGYGPVIADIARQVARAQPESQWRYAVTNPGSGEILGEGVIRRRPSASQRRQVEHRNPRCIFPGCRMPARQCDLDHRKRWIEAKETKTENLVPLCRHDHWVRHRAGWEHKPLPDNDHLWTSPLGLQYTTSGRPPP
jgi:Domain of unknown function (DUF222)